MNKKWLSAFVLLGAAFVTLIFAIDSATISATTIPYEALGNYDEEHIVQDFIERYIANHDANFAARWPEVALIDARSDNPPLWVQLKNDFLQYRRTAGFATLQDEADALKYFLINSLFPAQLQDKQDSGSAISGNPSDGTWVHWTTTDSYEERFEKWLTEAREIGAVAMERQRMGLELLPTEFKNSFQSYVEHGVTHHFRLVFEQDEY